MRPRPSLALVGSVLGLGPQSLREALKRSTGRYARDPVPAQDVHALVRTLRSRKQPAAGPPGESISIDSLVSVLGGGREDIDDWFLEVQQAGDDTLPRAELGRLLDAFLARAATTPASAAELAAPAPPSVSTQVPGAEATRLQGPAVDVQAQPVSHAGVRSEAGPDSASPSLQERGRGRLVPAEWRGRVTPLRPVDPPRVGDYEVLARLGHGGMGTVYQARREGTGGDVALKVLAADLHDDADAQRRFLREADVLTRVGGAFSARVLDRGTDDGVPFLVMELLDGLSLDQAVQKVGALAAPALRAVALGLADGLRAVHSARIVHRDVKPSNVMLTSAGPKLIDFGVARLTAGTQYTKTGSTIGTYAFMAPEQFRDEPATPALDVFAWAGVVLFAATAELPFPGSSTAAVMRQVLHGDPPGLARVEDVALRGVLTAALRKSPSGRPSAPDLITALLEGQPGRALATQVRAPVRHLLGLDS